MKEKCSECGEEFTTIMGRRYFIMRGNESEQVCKKCYTERQERSFR